MIGGDHFEYRVYSHMVPLIFLSFLWLLNGLKLRARTAAVVFSTFIALALPVPWIHWHKSQAFAMEETAFKLCVPVAGSLPAPLRWYGEIFDINQSWLIHREHGRGSFFLYYHPGELHPPFQARAEDLERMGLGDRPVDHYDAEVARVDENVGRLLATLKELEIEERTLVVVISDHGAALDGKSSSSDWVMSEEMLPIVLLMRVPGYFFEPFSMPGFVFSIDVMPTLLDLMGISRPPVLQGTSLVSLMRREPVDIQATFHYMPQEGFIALGMQQWRMFVDMESGGSRLMDLSAARRSEDVSGMHPTIAKKLRKTLERMRSRQARENEALRSLIEAERGEP